MESVIRELLSSKGLNVSDDDYRELARQWAAILQLKRGFEREFAGESDVALKYLPGGDHV